MKISMTIANKKISGKNNTHTMIEEYANEVIYEFEQTGSKKHIAPWQGNRFLKKEKRSQRKKLDKVWQANALNREEVLEKLIIQSDDLTSNIFGSFARIMDLLKQTNNEFLIKLMEDLVVMIYWLVRSRTKIDYVMAITTFIKHRSGKSITLMARESELVKKFEHIFKESGSGVQSVDETLTFLRSALDRFKTVKENAIVKRFYKFIMYCLSLSLFEGIGIKFSNLNYSKAEEAAIKEKYTFGTDFIECVLDTLLFMCERGWQCFKTGSLSPLLHSGSTYEKWFDKATTLKRQSNFLSDPEPHNFTIFEFFNDLDDTIEKGTAIVKWNEFSDAREKNFINRLLDDLKLIRATEVTRKAAQQERKAPLGLLLFSTPGAGKSTFTKLLFYHFASLFDLPKEDEYRYVRNFADQYWSGFKSYKWCIQLDDIAFLNPNVASAGGDPSVMEMLNVVNSVPFVPTQADLADKGKTPVRAKLVIATTNTKELNTIHYFSCPMAVNRRLPIVVTLSVKPQYQKEARFLDAGLAPEVVPGSYPDYWNILVQKVVSCDDSKSSTDPNFENMVDETISRRAKFENLQMFSNIYDFLAWFSAFAIKFEQEQGKVLSSDKCMRDVSLCKKCFYPTNLCKCTVVQTDDVEEVTDPENDNSHTMRLIAQRAHERVLQWSHNWRPNRAPDLDAPVGRFNAWHYIQYKVFRWAEIVHLFEIFLIFLLTNWFTYWCIKRLPVNGLLKIAVAWMSSWVVDPQIQRILIRLAGENAFYKLRRTAQMLKIMGALVTVLAMYKAGSMLFKNFYKSPLDEMRPQTRYSEKFGKKPEAKDEEREEVWYKDDYKTTTFDTGRLTPSWKQMGISKVAKILSENCVTLLSTREVDGKIVRRQGRAFCVGGHIYMTNNHCLPEHQDLSVSLIQSSSDTGITSNVDFILRQNEIYRIPDRDLCFVRLRQVPPRKDLRELFAKKTFRGFLKGVYVSKNARGQIVYNPVAGIKLHEQYHIDELKSTTDIWCGTAQTPTEIGDCGAVLLAEAPCGPVILGIHVLGLESSVRVGAHRVTIDMIEDAIQTFGDIIIQSGTPELSSDSARRAVVDLHYKSPFRYMDKGVANVYGSFTGFRPASKSRVTKTYICDSMRKRGYEVKTAPPTMAGWVPWRLAGIEMVQPTCNVDSVLLARCVDYYTTDILNSLTSLDLKELTVLDNMTAINGFPGVTYIDKINRSTSMGNPWKTSKKFYLVDLEPNEIWQEPVMFTDEIMDRVDVILQRYHNGERTMPNFCAHLKDEPISKAKAESGKTRVFTGAPVDWSIVVRKYLLSFVRLVQNNRFVFEACPGTVTQSLEWEQMRAYLVAFGEDRIVAGDYGKFDKRMIAPFILAAYDIIYNIHKVAGWSEEDLRVIMGIAEDTAFPLIDFNGDLVEFYGSNPSGHPLTVIINSLVNALYMRYCYAKLNPNGEIATFKQNVHLMTYGDDNVMGVHPDANWFNHTAIQKTLADIGVEYTMADKTSESVPFISLNDISFLKRRWRWDEDVGAYLCPLEHDSIAKMLTMYVPDGSDVAEAHSAKVIVAACNEYFFYGKTVFEEKRKMFLDVIRENQLEPYKQPMPTWQELYDRFWRASRHVKYETPHRPEL